MSDTRTVADRSADVPSAFRGRTTSGHNGGLDLPNVPQYKLAANDEYGVPQRVTLVSSHLWDADQTGHIQDLLGYNPRAHVWLLPRDMPLRALAEPRRPLGPPSAEA